MNTELFQTKHDELFREWNDRVKADHHVAIDGVPYPESYFAPDNRPRILYVLKEMNAAPWNQPDLLVYLQKHNDRSQTWNNIARWTMAIQHAWNNQPLSFDDVRTIGQHQRAEAIKRIAAINLKKVPGFSSSNMDQINAYAKQYSDLLRRQVAMIDPDVIVASGVYIKRIQGFDALKEEGNDAALHFFEGRDRLVIWMHHPQARKNAEGMFNDAVQAAHKGLGLLQASMPLA